MSIKFNHPPFLSEKEICDQLEVYFNELSVPEMPTYREYCVGPGRVDFASFYPGNIDLTEVKITANWAALRQLAFYKRAVEEHVRMICYKDGFYSPKVTASLYAVNFDFEIIDACLAFGICTQKIIINKKRQVSLTDPDFDILFDISLHENLVGDLEKIYKENKNV